MALAMVGRVEARWPVTPGSEFLRLCAWSAWSGKVHRAQVDSGRLCLRETVFGDPAEPHHREALAIIGQTGEAEAAVVCRGVRVSEADAATTARVVSAVMFLAMAASVNVAASVDEILRDIREQIAVLLPR